MNEMDNKSGENSKEHKCALCPYSAKQLDHLKIHMTTHSNVKPFKCPECPFKSKWKQGVKNHVKMVHLLQSLPMSSRPFPCSHSGCNYAAKQNSKLVRHSIIHSDQQQFSCAQPKCNFSTNRKQSLTEHTQIHTGEKPWVCQFESCSYATAYRNALVAHTRTHTKERPYKCPEHNCEYSSTQNSNLRQHQLTHHPTEGEEPRPFKCPLCEYKGKSKGVLSQHIKSHILEKNFKCNQPGCNFEAKNKTNLELHGKVVHSDERPFSCPVELYQYRCKTKSALSGHLKSHSEERRYQCELCPFRAKTRANVKRHLQYVHSDPNFRPFKCTEPKCEYAAKGKSDLNTHVLIHKGDKKFNCSFPGCKYKAILKAMIKKHEKRFHKTEELHGT